VDAVIFSVDDETSEDDRVRGGLTCHADPPFGGCLGWAVDDPFVFGFVESGGGLEALDVRAVTQLSHGVTAKDSSLLHVR